MKINIDLIKTFPNLLTFYFIDSMNFNAEFPTWFFLKEVCGGGQELFTETLMTATHLWPRVSLVTYQAALRLTTPLELRQRPPIACLQGWADSLSETARQFFFNQRPSNLMWSVSHINLYIMFYAFTTTTSSNWLPCNLLASSFRLIKCGLFIDC